MKISQLQLNNVRSFVGPKDNPIVEINFSETINVIIGANNSGKSTIMNTLHSMQNSAIINKSYIRSGLPNCVYYIHFLKIDKRKFKQKGEILKKGHLTFALKEGQNLVTSLIIEGEGVLILDQPLSPLPEPENLIYPFTAERKEIRGFEEKFNEQTAFNVLPNLTNLYAKISHLSQSGHKRNAIFTEYCKDLLGFIITAVPSGQGQKASLYIDNQKSIPIDSMGDGVTQILGLLVSLCVAKDQIFLIEELENDLHPIALKKLLDLILLKSPENQFIISTHSHIVLNHLGSDPKTKIIETKMSLDENSIPLTAIREVKEPADRIKVLEDLGYSLSDYSLWEGWLILEESSAEKVIREFLIPNFAPKLLGKIRTIGAKGDSDAETHFMNYERLFLYAHLESRYKNKAWIILDSNKKEKIATLQSKYLKSGWNESNFRVWSKNDFEEYYPSMFQAEINKIQLLSHDEKRAPKKALLDQVVDFYKANEEEARKEFSNSASEIIECLKEIEEILIK